MNIDLHCFKLISKTNLVDMQIFIKKSIQTVPTRILYGLLLCFIVVVSVNAQNVGIGTNTPNQKAVLDISSSDKGILIPRMNASQRANMAATSSEEGMLVYDTSLDEFMYYNGSSWENVAGQSIWSQFGSVAHYLTGTVGVGTAVPLAKLELVNDNITTSIKSSNNYTGSSAKYGILNLTSAGGTGTRYGFYNSVSSNTSDNSSSYGIYNYNATNSSGGNVFGVYSNVVSNGTGIHYGMYSYAYGDGNYGIYSSNSHSNGYAGYFQGRGHFTGDLFIGNLITIDALGYQSGGEIIVKGSGDKEGVRLRGNEGANNGGAVLVYNKAGDVQIELDGEYGDGGPGRIITDELQIKGGSDLSENFDIILGMDLNEPKAGMLVSIDPNSSGKLIISTESYDRKVAGVISGANGVNPGMLMGQEETIADGEYPIALSGRVYVYADASNGSIQPGDLLTTSKNPGHAMKANDYKKAQGSVIGKAMTELKEGTGFVLVLVNLQ
jgi:hypothetical protein